jgi:salicylate hydroxylase
VAVCHTLSKQLFGLITHRIIHRADYQDALVMYAIEVGVEMRFGTEVVGVDFERSSVMLASGEVVEGDVVIGADGKSILCVQQVSNYTFS